MREALPAQTPFSGPIWPAVFQLMATFYDFVIFGASMYKTLEGFRHYARDRSQSTLGLMGAHSVIYFLCVDPP